MDGGEPAQEWVNNHREEEGGQRTSLADAISHRERRRSLASKKDTLMVTPVKGFECIQESHVGTSPGERGPGEVKTSLAGGDDGNVQRLRSNPVGTTKDAMVHIEHAQRPGGVTRVNFSTIAWHGGSLLGESAHIRGIEIARRLAHRLLEVQSRTEQNIGGARVVAISRIGNAVGTRRRVVGELNSQIDLVQAERPFSVNNDRGTFAIQPRITGSAKYGGANNNLLPMIRQRVNNGLVICKNIISSTLQEICFNLSRMLLFLLENPADTLWIAELTRIAIQKKNERPKDQQACC